MALFLSFSISVTVSNKISEKPFIFNVFYDVCFKFSLNLLSFAHFLHSFKPLKSAGFNIILLFVFT